MVGRDRRGHTCAGLSSEARAWERRRLRELGLEDISWDHVRWCPRCRVSSGAMPGTISRWKLPADKRDELAKAPQTSTSASHEALAKAPQTSTSASHEALAKAPQTSTSASHESSASHEGMPPPAREDGITGGAGVGKERLARRRLRRRRV
ncbi:hypothetical protein [Chondromyces crocatus]|uniref:Uncharacterized protein n=1 Tax=Chondromyces crocatus TaxID=52 RepID=A0A0K1EEF1_CHOCO|nr:hypothetical protein [Chondromyces crocatus]AKT39246.1 uncharacterized protein CMC5_033940 [Chondromyces crocatus]